MTSPPARPWLLPSDLEADRAHELEGVALLDDAGSHAVVELHAPLDDLVLEVHVAGDRREGVGDTREGEVVGGDQAERPACQKPANHGLGADAAIVRVGAVEDLVEQEQDGKRALREAHDLAQPRDLGVEA